MQRQQHQLATLGAAMIEILECADATHVDSDLRLAWIGHRTAEAMAAASEDYTTAEAHKNKANVLAGLMRLYATAAGSTVAPQLTPMVLGGGALNDFWDSTEQHTNG